MIWRRWHPLSSNVTKAKKWWNYAQITEISWLCSASFLFLLCLNSSITPRVLTSRILVALLFTRRLHVGFAFFCFSFLASARHALKSVWSDCEVKWLKYNSGNNKKLWTCYDVNLKMCCSTLLNHTYDWFHCQLSRVHFFLFCTWTSGMWVQYMPLFTGLCDDRSHWQMILLWQC